MKITIRGYKDMSDHTNSFARFLPEGVTDRVTNRQRTNKYHRGKGQAETGAQMLPSRMLEIGENDSPDTHRFIKLSCPSRKTRPHPIGLLVPGSE